MLSVAALSAGVAGAATGDSDTFVLAYACLLYLLAARYARSWRQAAATRPLTGRLSVGNALGATLWLASLALAEDVRPYVWAVAMILLISTFALAPWSRSRDPFHPGHVAERYGLFTIVVLGESIVVTVADLETGSALLAVLGFTIAAAICGSTSPSSGACPPQALRLPFRLGAGSPTHLRGHRGRGRRRRVRGRGGGRGRAARARRPPPAQQFAARTTARTGSSR